MAIDLGNIDKRIEDIGSTTGDDQMVTRAKISLGNIEKANAAIEQQTGWTVDLTDGLIEGGLEIDASGSMDDEYYNGNVQSAAERVTAFYAIVDGNGKFPVGFFGTDATEPVELNLTNYRGWVGSHVPRLSATNLFEAIYRGAEMAAEALERPEILELVAHRKSGFSRNNVEWIRPYADLRPIAAPRLFHFTVITDGAPTAGPREQAIRELIIRLSFCGIFIKFIFVGRDRDGEKFLDDLDDMKQRAHAGDPNRKDVNDPTGTNERLRHIDNVDKVKFKHGLGRVSDQDFASAMNQELDTYVPSAVKRGLLVPA